MITAMLKVMIVLNSCVLFVIKLTGLDFSDFGGKSSFLGLYVTVSLFSVVFLSFLFLKTE